MTIHAPQIIWLLLVAIGLGVDAERHGTLRTGTYSFWTSLIAATLTGALLWWGGFFGAH